MDEPTSAEDRSTATLCWLLGIFFAFIPSLVLFVLKRERSAFVGFHGLQALLWHLALMLLSLPLFGGAVVLLFAGLARLPHRTPQAPPAEVFMAFGGIWLLAVALGLVNVIVQVAMAVKANGGKWTRLPVIGNLALVHGPARGR